MHTIELLQEWDVTKVVDLSHAYIEDFVPDFANSCLWATEKTSKQIFNFDISTGMIQIRPLSGISEPTNIALDGSNKLYVADRSASRIHIVEANIGNLNLEKTIAVGRAGASEPWDMDGFTQGVVVNVASKKQFKVSKYSVEGKILWSWNAPIGFNMPSGMNNLIPVVKGEYVYAVTASNAINVYKLDTMGELIEHQEIVSLNNNSVSMSTLGGKKLVSWPVHLVSATKGPNEETILLLYSDDRNGVLLLLYCELGAPSLAFKMPVGLSKIAMLSNDIIVGYRKSMYFQESKFFLFSCPRWELGTKLEEVST
jgi:hypothetical protein